MKFFLIFVLVLIGKYSFALDGQEVRNGGGGLSDGGHYMTFYSSNIPVFNEELQAEDIPGMKYLITKIMGFTMTEEAKKDLLSCVYPGIFRSYYKVDDASISIEEKQQLVIKYAKLAGVPENKVVLFAATDFQPRTTALFPNFFQLKEVEQAAMLIHESTWICRNGTDFKPSYSDVVGLEMAAQAYFENPQSPQAFFEFYKKISLFEELDGDVLTYASLHHDLEAKLLQSPGLKNGQIYLRDFLGPSFIHCETVTSTPYYECPSTAANYQIQRSLELPPDHLFIKALVSRRSIIQISSIDQGAHVISSLTEKDLNKLYIDFNKNVRGQEKYFLIYKFGSSKPIAQISI